MFLIINNIQEKGIAHRSSNWPVGYINTIRIFTPMIPIVSCFLILEQSFSSAHYPSRINTTFRKVGASFTVISAKGRAMT